MIKLFCPSFSRRPSHHRPRLKAKLSVTMVFPSLVRVSWGTIDNDSKNPCLGSMYARHSQRWKERCESFAERKEAGWLLPNLIASQLAVRISFISYLISLLIILRLHTKHKLYPEHPVTRKRSLNRWSHYRSGANCALIQLLRLPGFYSYLRSSLGYNGEAPIQPLSRLSACQI